MLYTLFPTWKISDMVRNPRVLGSSTCNIFFCYLVETHFFNFSRAKPKSHTLPFGPSDSSNLSRSSSSATSGSGGVRRSFPPGLDEALPYQIIPMIAIIIPRTTCRLRPSFPKKVNPRVKTRIVFMWPRTWKVTAENLPMQMNWLRLVPIAMTQERRIKNCRESNVWLVNKNKFRLTYVARTLNFTSITKVGH